jgi:uncharacterized protein
MRHAMQVLARSVVAGLALGAITSFPSLATAQSAAEKQPGATRKDAALRLITVDGVGEVALPPDSLRTSVGVEARAVTLEAARGDATRRAQAVFQAVQNLAIPALEVRTVDVSISPITEPILEPAVVRTPRITGYSASSRLSVALRGVSADKLRAEGARILEAALAAGANDIGGLEFFLKDPKPARRMALAAAVRDAQENAEVVAGSAKIKLVELRSVKVARETLPFQPFAQSAIGFGEPAAFPVEPGNVRVTASVTSRISFSR